MKDNPPFAFQAAKASWLAPLIAIGLGVMGNIMMANNASIEVETRRAVQLIVGIIAIAIVLIGLTLGIVALFGIKKHGMKGILVPSIIGILLSSGYLYLVISAILLVRRLVQEGAASPA